MGKKENGKISIGKTIFSCRFCATASVYDVINLSHNNHKESLLRAFDIVHAHIYSVHCVPYIVDRLRGVAGGARNFWTFSTRRMSKFKTI